MKSQVQAPLLMASRRAYSTLVIRFIIAPLLGLFSGFHTMDFLLGGLYTWPQMSRVMALTLAIVILSYEFVYKEDRDQFSEQQGRFSPHGVKAVFYSCLIPYMVGCLLLLLLIIVSQ